MNPTKRTQKRSTSITKKLQVRRKTLPPKDLEKLIEIVNSLPEKKIEEEALELEWRLIDEAGLREEVKTDEDRERLFSINSPRFRDYLPALHNSFLKKCFATKALGNYLKYLFNIKNPPLWSDNVEERIQKVVPVLQIIDYLFSMRDSLTKIAKAAVCGGTLEPTQEMIEIFAAITIKEGRIHPIYDRFYSALIGIEASRIRLCPICNFIFWAGRSDQSTCSKRCANNFRVRKWRASYPEKYKLQRCCHYEKKEGKK
jgi:hypothetical protein